MLAEYELNRERNEELFVSAGKDNVCPVHFHRKVEVMYVTSGVKNFVAAGKETSLAADGIFFANSYEMHGYTESEGSTQTVIVFPNRMLGNYYDCFGDKMPLGNTVDDKDFCRTLLPHFEALAAGGGNKLLAQAHCDFILGSLMEKLGTAEGVKERQSFVDGLLAYINENYAEDIDLDGMAEHFGYSKYYFCSLFRQATGMSYMTYLKSVRIFHACLLLQKGEPVQSVAAAVGFCDAAHFIQVFKQEQGLSPRRYALQYPSPAAGAEPKDCRTTR